MIIIWPERESGPVLPWCDEMRGTYWTQSSYFDWGGMAELIVGRLFVPDIIIRLTAVFSRDGDYWQCQQLSSPERWYHPSPLPPLITRSVTPSYWGHWGRGCGCVGQTEGTVWTVWGYESLGVRGSYSPTISPTGILSSSHGQCSVSGRQARREHVMSQWGRERVLSTPERIHCVNNLQLSAIGKAKLALNSISQIVRPVVRHVKNPDGGR